MERIILILSLFLDLPSCIGNEQNTGHSDDRPADTRSSETLSVEPDNEVCRPALLHTPRPELSGGHPVDCPLERTGGMCNGNSVGDQ